VQERVEGRLYVLKEGGLRDCKGGKVENPPETSLCRSWSLEGEEGDAGKRD